MAKIVPASAPTPFDSGVDSGFHLGRWYWVKAKVEYAGEEDGMKRGQKYEWLGCITYIGTNYVEISAPSDGQHERSQRVHLDKVHETLRAEPNAEAIIAANAERSRDKIVGYVDQVRAITARLGVATAQIAAPAESSSTALAVISGTANVKEYEKALIKAKDKDLPALFKAIKEESKELSRWLTAPTLPMHAEIGIMKGVIEKVDDRIFNVGLYAGLTEQVVKCADGPPAGATDKLHVMQRRLYMDEECLLNYEAGGMEFSDIESFDEWMARPENRDRILPFPRTVVSMRVRRRQKERDAGGNFMQAFINIELADADKTTFLYIRNGAQVWRLSCAQDFGATLFPETELEGEGRPMMIKPRFDDVDGFMPVSEYEVRCREVAEAKAKLDAWRKANPKKGWIDEPYELRYHRDFRPDDWEPFDPGSVYYDDATAKIEKAIKAYNRIVLILQGLLDRSPVLHPHPPINLWREDHMATHVELVRDSGGLMSGDKPDFEAYRDRLNRSITTASYLVGQRKVWRRREAEKENARNRGRYGSRSMTLLEYEPYGNPGPKTVCKPVAWSPRSRKATFSWERQRLRYSPSEGTVTASITVAASDLLNVSAYKPGEYLQFFNDHRTRQQYLVWAPLLLAAEDHHAGHKAKDRGDSVYNT